MCLQIFRSEERTAKTDIVVVLQPVNRIDLAADVELLHRIVEIADRGMLIVAAENLLGLLSPAECQ
jgi:ABC-type uncharacterized transport system ATPase subunit